MRAAPLIHIRQRGIMTEEFRVGVISSVHGIRGEAKVFITSDDPEERARGSAALRYSLAALAGEAVATDESLG